MLSFHEVPCVSVKGCSRFSEAVTIETSRRS